MTLMAKMDSIKNALGGADKFHTSTVVGILEEANTMMGIKTEGVIAKRVEKVLAEIGSGRASSSSSARTGASAERVRVSHTAVLR